MLFIDCGQGDAALVECDGKYMLVDGGNKDSSQLLYKTLKDRNITYLDIVIATHPHEDHIGGIPGALNYADAGLILCNVSKYESEEFYDFENYSNLKGNGITVPSQGANYSLGSSEITILGLNNGGSINDDSIVFRISYGNTSILFMGDAEHAGENAILGGADSLESTAIKIGHHGADNATSDSLINAVKPQ